MSDTLTAQEIWKMFAETDRKMQETDRKMQETDRKLKESWERTERALREMSKKIGDLGNRLGEFVESAVRPAAVELFQSRGIKVQEVHADVSVERGGMAAQFDLLVVNDEELVAVECKSKADIEDVKTHLERLAKVRTLLPKYADSRVYGAIATMVALPEVARFAESRGLFVIVQSGETVTLANSESFKPAVF